MHLGGAAEAIDRPPIETDLLLGLRPPNSPPTPATQASGQPRGLGLAHPAVNGNGNGKKGAAKNCQQR